MAGPSEEEIAQLWAIHNSDERRRENMLRAYGFDTTRSWVSPDGYRLSDRIWRARKAVRDQIDQVLREAIANGTDALEVAEILEQYLNPELAPVRNALGRLIRNQKPVIVSRAPGRGGMGSFSARRLARTEITRAHGQATIETAKRTPFATGVKWNLSGRHPRSDICDQHSRADDYDLGPGVYPPDKVPQYPSHPHDLCNLSTATDDDIDGVVARLREQYGLAASDEPTTTFTAASTVAGAKSAAADLGLDVSGVTPSTLHIANLINEAATQLRSFGLSPNRPIRIRGGVSPDKSFADFNPRGKTPVLNVWKDSEFWKDPQSWMTAMYDKQLMTSPDAAGVLRHEMGHAIHYNASPYNLLKRPLGGQYRETAMKVSRYAASNSAEFVAEVFAGITGGRTYPDDVMELYRMLEGPKM